MEFRLIYQGPLLTTSSSNKRREHKHEIRKKLHAQLAELWKVHPAIKRLPSVTRHAVDAATGKESHRSRLDDLADAYTRCGFRFAPLINPNYSLLCDLDILFLRRGEPGSVYQGGDLDNRLKTLLDALRMPTEAELPEGAVPGTDENPFFCLLSDDSLIARLKITTDRLLFSEKETANELVKTDPKDEGFNHPSSKVYLVINVQTLVADPNLAYLEMSL